MSSTAAGADLSIIVPTLNESGNITELVGRLESCLAGIHWEVIFVDDDSRDDTVQIVRSISRRDQRIRCIQRIGRRGLSSACIEGMLASSAPYLAVLDADLQHDETLLRKMFDILQENASLDIVVGSRYVKGGDFGDVTEDRVEYSRLATRVSRVIIPAELQDPMSGFFMIRQAAFQGCVHDLSGLGFKILLDLFASSPRPLRFIELPYSFRERHAGESKLDSSVAWNYLMLILDKLVGRYVPVRFIVFSLVGGLGILLHLSMVGLLYRGFGMDFVYSQVISAVLTMTFNYSLNNLTTYRDMRLHGLRWIMGLFTFILACSVGAVANIGIASYLFEQETTWSLAVLAGTIVGAVWNYVVTMLYTWNKR